MAKQLKERNRWWATKPGYTMGVREESGVEHPARRHKVNPAGTKIARKAKDGRCTLR